jgi:hypothetical protein
MEQRAELAHRRRPVLLPANEVPREDIELCLGASFALSVVWTVGDARR